MNTLANIIGAFLGGLVWFALVRMSLSSNWGNPGVILFLGGASLLGGLVASTFSQILSGSKSTITPAIIVAILMLIYFGFAALAGLTFGGELDDRYLSMVITQLVGVLLGGKLSSILWKKRSN